MGFESTSFPLLKTNTPITTSINGENDTTLSHTERVLLHHQRKWLSTGHPRTIAAAMDEIIEARRGAPISKIVCLAISDIGTATTDDCGLTDDRFFDIVDSDRKDPVKYKELRDYERHDDKNRQVQQFILLSQMAASLAVANPEILDNMYAQDPQMSPDTRDIFQNHGFKILESPQAFDLIDNNTLVYAPFMPFTVMLWEMENRAHHDIGMMVGNDYLHAQENLFASVYAPGSRDHKIQSALKPYEEMFKLVAGVMMDTKVCNYRKYLPFDYSTNAGITDYFHPIWSMQVWWRPKPADGKKTGLIESPFVNTAWDNWGKANFKRCFED